MSLPGLFLNYHEVRAEHSAYLYSLPVAEFDAHVRLVAAPPPDARSGLGITFDDGHVTQFEQAFPVLERHGVKAIFFVTAGFTECEPDHMTWTQIRELVSAGHEVHAHGWMHRFFTHCSEAELAEELNLSKKALEDRLGCEVDALSLPGGRFNARVLQACRAAGYRRIFTSEPWPPERRENGLTLFGRFGIQSGTSAATLARLMRTSGRPSVRERLSRRAKLGLRHAIGDAAYHRLWCLLAHGNPGAEENAGPRH
jgi:peptidoglycan/xylan/chitin deacetylase (PgdA/CDA1 family)